MWTRGPLSHYTQLFFLLSLLSLDFPEATSESSENLLNSSEDYYDLYGISPVTKTPGSATRDGVFSEPCYNDLCQDLPAPCAQLAAKLHCSCPGVSMGPHVLPEAPTVIIWQEGGEAKVRWCTAHAYETKYRVLVQGEEVGEFGELKRSMVIKGLRAGDRVCVQAVNDVGSSVLEGKACKVYEPPKGSPSLALKVGLIGGALGILLLVSIALLLWRLRSRQKNGSHVSAEGPL